MVILKYKVFVNIFLKYDMKFFILFDWKFSCSENDVINMLGYVLYLNFFICFKILIKLIIVGF